MKNLKFIAAEFLCVVQSTKNLSKKTVVAYLSDLNDFNNFVGKNELNNETILNYIQELSQNRKLKDNTIIRKLIVIKMFMEYMHSKEYIDVDYFQL